MDVITLGVVLSFLGEQLMGHVEGKLFIGEKLSCIQGGDYVVVKLNDVLRSPSIGGGKAYITVYTNSGKYDYYLGEGASVVVNNHKIEIGKVNAGIGVGELGTYDDAPWAYVEIWGKYCN